jgi:hypothetical protein
MAAKRRAYPPHRKLKPPGGSMTRTNSIIANLFVAFFLFAVLAPVSAGGGAEEPETARMAAVTMYTNGTSLVTFEARVSGSGSLELAVPGEDMLDILKTLVVRDLDGGTIASAGFTARDPASRSLGRLSVDLSGNPGIHELLSRSRGMDVRLSTGESLVSGQVLGLENRSSPGGSGEHVNLLVQGSIRSIPLASISSLSYRDAATRDDIDSALELIRDASSQERKTITIEYRGEGQRRLLISYLRPAPVWKPGYRLITDESVSILQGWAIVENTGSNDWNGVMLSLSTADPVSFVMDLYTPRYINRPTLSPPGLSAAEVPSPVQASPSVADRSFSESSARASAPMMMAEEAAAYDNYELDDYTGAVDSAASRASAVSGGTLASVFEYRLDEPVNIRAQNSAMVPIVNAELALDSFITWQSDRTNLVYRAFDIENISDNFFSAGPLAIYDDGRFAGEAVLSFMAPGGTQRIEYALENSVRVLPVESPISESLFDIRAADGVLETRYRRERSRGYRAQNNSDDFQRLRLMHRVESGWSIEDAPEYADAGNYAEFPMDLPPGESVEIGFVETMELSRSFQLINLQDANIEIFIKSGTLSEEQIRILQRVAELRRDLAEVQQEISLRNSEVNRIYREQERIVRNMENLQQDSALYGRYLESLSSQEDRLEELVTIVGDLESEQADRQRALADFIAEVEFQ